VKLSVIISTDNQPLFLEKVLWGYTAQTRRDFEIVIADGGSGPETARVVARFRSEADLTITHVWHGGEHRALGYLLENAGVRGKQVRHRAVCMHLPHDRPYRDQATVRANRARLEHARRSGLARAERGIAELPLDPSLRVDGRSVGQTVLSVSNTPAPRPDAVGERGSPGERNQTWP
jgi:glycosyltransferase involved in cell wall biosynthesis